MSPFQKNLQRFLVLIFTAVSVLLVVVGINRTKSGSIFAVPAVGQEPVITDTKTTSPTPTAQGSRTFTGKPYQTPWGNAVASISVANGKIIGVTMPEVPQSPPSQYAESILVKQAISAGSANIQGVSGATYTSIAFKSSLENAIAKAGGAGQAVTAPTSGTLKPSPSVKPSVPRSYQREDDEREIEY